MTVIQVAVEVIDEELLQRLTAGFMPVEATTEARVASWLQALVAAEVMGIRVLGARRPEVEE